MNVANYCVLFFCGRKNQSCDVINQLSMKHTNLSKVGFFTFISHYIRGIDVFMHVRFNTRIYNFISVQQITRLLLGDAIISSKTDSHNGSKKEKRSYGEVKNNNTMLKILPFIQILYLKQQSSILRYFCRLNFEKGLINNMFFSFTFHSKMISSYS